MSDAVRWLRWLFPVALLVVGLVVFRDELPFLGEAWSALRHASPRAVALAVLSAVASIVAMSAAMQLLMNIQGRITGLRRCTAITLASNAWSTTIPGGPALSAWLTYRVHRAWGASPGLCGWFFVISGALSTVWLVVIGAISVIFLGASLSVGALAASLAVAVTVAAALFWATRNPGVLRCGVRLTPQRVQGRLEDVVGQISAIRMSGGAFALTAMFSLANRLLDAATLFFATWAVTGEPSLRTVALAFVMTKLAGAAQVTPGGVGTVEAVTAGVMVASGLSLADATAATLLYRLISFAFITALGWIVYVTRYAGRGFMLGAPAR
ncbi:YbhN family protein [Corynebacterium sp.]|uniref:lysylphosphatidylglycerol synthase transmembrane domain-containing protein n=1 Tax=Corynebacterium sp. TaxID=1720 RepID=UPI002A90E296|nr:YbhN family protein [Corynebacterium sp.]MDY5785075.1 YbhN family protein [Corynebacterium sp.]